MICRYRCTLLAALCCLVSQLSLAAPIPTHLIGHTQVAEPFIGVTYYQITQSLDDPGPKPFPRPVAIHMVEINPHAPGISFLGTPGNGDAPNEYTRMTTGAFVTNNGLAVGINGDFYDTSTGLTTNVNGLGMSNGEVVSPPGTGGFRNSLIVREDNVAWILTTSTIPPGAWNAVSGNQRMLQSGEIVTPNNSYTNTLNPHTAVGVDNDNGHLWFMVVDGRQTNYSDGMRTDEMAQLFLDFGVDNAINLDGGGSSTLVFADGFGGTARAVNSPSDGATTQSPGFQRSVGNHFGVYAQPNPDYVRLPNPPRPGAGLADPYLSQLTIFDDFESGEGRFTWNPTDSGSTSGVLSTSTATHYLGDGFTGNGSQQITLVRNSAASSVVRHVSGGGVPSNNRVLQDSAQSAMGPFGFVGFFMKTTQPDLQVFMGIDDGLSAGSVGMERSTALSVIADGQWHLYEWNLADPGVWSNFSGGNGMIDGPNAYIDSIFIQSGASTAGQTFSVLIDTVAYNPLGSLAELIEGPDPSLPGDFNGDGMVDGRDLLAWQRGDSPKPLSSSDLTDWQDHYGQTSPANFNTVVPEPASVALLAAGSIVVWVGGRRRF